MMTSNEIFDLVNKYLSEQSYLRKPKQLYEPIRYELLLGGKRIRPTLMLLAYNLYKDNPESIISAACALETYHNYTLLHDDLMDHASMRRGKPTVHTRWSANQAILSGDTMLVLAYQRMMDVDAKLLPQTLDLFTETALEIGEGQQMDMEFESRNDVTEEEYIEMIRLKTSVLLACALKMGAILAGASEEDADVLYKYGELIGLAFQLQDDYLDVYGTPEVFGKLIGGDIVSNKKTFMLINAYLKASGEQRGRLDELLSAEKFDSQEKIKQVRDLYDDLEIDRLAQERITSYFEQAAECLKRLSVDSAKLVELESYTAKMMKRNK